MHPSRTHVAQPVGGPVGVLIRPAHPDEGSLAADIDDDACSLYADAGLPFDEAQNPGFFAREQRRWDESLAQGRQLLACAPSGEPVGFAALGYVGEAPMLLQLSVRRAWMRQGIGRALLARALQWSERAGALWITTYDHLPWNGPFYTRMGFETPPESSCSDELRGILDDERSALPAPERRALMVYVHPRGERPDGQ